MSELFSVVDSGSLVLNMPEFKGYFEMDVRSHVLRRILTEGQYEPEVIKILTDRVDPNRDAIDVGANAGLFTVLLSKLLCGSNRVLAVEPTPGALRYLKENLTRNDCMRNVILFEGVASSSSGDIEIKVIEGKEEYSSIGNMAHPAISEERYSVLKTKSQTLDEMIENSQLRPGFIKIDTEGAEHEVLLGAEKTMRNHRPIILCESWDDATLAKSGGIPGAVAALLKSRGYSISEPLEGELLAIPL